MSQTNFEVIQTLKLLMIGSFIFKLFCIDPFNTFKSMRNLITIVRHLF